MKTIPPSSIPLIAGVPVIDVDREFGAPTGYHGVVFVAELGCLYVVDQHRNIHGPIDSDGSCDWRIDLNEPLGVAHAWLLLAPHFALMGALELVEMARSIEAPDGPGNWRKRHERGETTYADRVAIARALTLVLS